MDTIGNIADKPYEDVKGLFNWTEEGLVLLSMIKGSIAKAGGAEALAYHITNGECALWFEKEERRAYKLRAIGAGVEVSHGTRYRAIDAAAFETIRKLWPTHNAAQISRITGIHRDSVRYVAHRFLEKWKRK